MRATGSHCHPIEPRKTIVFALTPSLTGKKAVKSSGAAVSAELTKETIERAFDAMGRMAAERGLVVDIAVYGGSCLVLASDIRNASVDVDAVFLTERSMVRDIADAVESDEDDAVALMKVTGITNREALVGLLQECYPHVPLIVEPALSLRISAKIDSLLDAYERSSDDPDPTWHAGRGRATHPRG